MFLKGESSSYPKEDIGLFFWKLIKAGGGMLEGVELN